MSPKHASRVLGVERLLLPEDEPQDEPQRQQERLQRQRQQLQSQLDRQLRVWEHLRSQQEPVASASGPVATAAPESPQRSRSQELLREPSARSLRQWAPSSTLRPVLGSASTGALTTEPSLGSALMATLPAPLEPLAAWRSEAEGALSGEALGEPRPGEEDAWEDELRALFERQLRSAEGEQRRAERGASAAQQALWRYRREAAKAERQHEAELSEARAGAEGAEGRAAARARALRDVPARLEGTWAQLRAEADEVGGQLGEMEARISASVEEAAEVRSEQRQALDELAGRRRELQGEVDAASARLRLRLGDVEGELASARRWRMAGTRASAALSGARLELRQMQEGPGRETEADPPSDAGCVMLSEHLEYERRRNEVLAACVQRIASDCDRAEAELLGFREAMQLSTRAVGGRIAAEVRALRGELTALVEQRRPSDADAAPPGVPETSADEGGRLHLAAHAVTEEIAELRELAARIRDETHEVMAASIDEASAASASAARDDAALRVADASGEADAAAAAARLAEVERQGEAGVQRLLAAQEWQAGQLAAAVRAAQHACASSAASHRQAELSRRAMELALWQLRADCAARASPGGLAPLQLAQRQSRRASARLAELEAEASADMHTVGVCPRSPPALPAPSAVVAVSQLRVELQELEDEVAGLAGDVERSSALERLCEMEAEAAMEDASELEARLAAEVRSLREVSLPEAAAQAEAEEAALQRLGASATRDAAVAAARAAHAEACEVLEVRVARERRAEAEVESLARACQAFVSCAMQHRHEETLLAERARRMGSRGRERQAAYQAEAAEVQRALEKQEAFYSGRRSVDEDAAAVRGALAVAAWELQTLRARREEASEGAVSVATASEQLRRELAAAEQGAVSVDARLAVLQGRARWESQQRMQAVHTMAKVEAEHRSIVSELAAARAGYASAWHRLDCQMEEDAAQSIMSRLDTVRQNRGDRRKALDDAEAQCDEVREALQVAKRELAEIRGQVGEAESSLGGGSAGQNPEASSSLCSSVEAPSFSGSRAGRLFLTTDQDGAPADEDELTALSAEVADLELLLPKVQMERAQAEAELRSLQTQPRPRTVFQELVAMREEQLGEFEAFEAEEEAACVAAEVAAMTGLLEEALERRLRSELASQPSDGGQGTCHDACSSKAIAMDTSQVLWEAYGFLSEQQLRLEAVLGERDLAQQQLAEASPQLEGPPADICTGPAEPLAWEPSAGIPTTS